MTVGPKESFAFLTVRAIDRTCTGEWSGVQPCDGVDAKKGTGQKVCGSRRLWMWFGVSHAELRALRKGWFRPCASLGGPGHRPRH